MLQRRKEEWLIVTCVFLNMITSQASLSSPIVLRKDPALMALVPAKAFEGIGSWSAGGYYIATGYSTPAESVGAEKEKGIEEKIAEKDAKGRIGHAAALRKNPQFDEESYTCQAEISGFRIATTYKLEGRDGLFVVGVAPEDAVRVNIAFDAGRARRNALIAFNAGDYGHAARFLAGLTERGFQDPEIIAMARAASATVQAPPPAPAPQPEATPAPKVVHVPVSTPLPPSPTPVQAAVPSDFVMSVLRAYNNHNYLALSPYLVPGHVNYFGHRDASPSFIRNDMTNDARTYAAVNCTFYPDTFTHEVSNEYSPHWVGPMLYDTITTDTEARELNGRVHRATTRFTVGYTVVNGASTPWSSR
jgi:hypothetical protein